MNKSKSNLKLYFALKILLVYAIICVKSFASDSKLQENIITMGADDALVKIKVFSSLTCPHCASFHSEVVPQIKKEYIDTGKAQLIFMDFPLDLAAFNASKLLHCIDQSIQIKFLDIVYEEQEKWVDGSNIDEINENLKKIVKNLGISSIQFDKCLNNQDISDRILDGRINANKKYSINSTPTIIINEKKLEETANFKNIKKKIEKII